MTQLSPEALAGLVERLNTEMAWPQQAMLCREAATAILALEAENKQMGEALSGAVSLDMDLAIAERKLIEITKHLDEGGIACKGGTMDWSLSDRVLIAVRASNDTEDRDRATRAEALLREIAEIVPEPLGDDGCACQSCTALRRIATLARSLTAPVEKEKE